LIKQYESAGFV